MVCQSILSKKGVNMTIVEKNVRAWNEQLGLKDKYKKEEKLSVAKKILKKGFSIEDIIDTTELTREEIMALQKKK
jgi:predicted transposase YdaD